MSEETEGQDTGAEAVAVGVDPAAVALALNGASRGEADAFLKNQSALIEIQKHHMSEQCRYLHEQFKQLRLGIWEKWVGVLLRVATLCVGIAAAGGVGLMVWNAATSNGLVVEPFSVPPDLANRGLTGQVVAAKLLDRLVTMQAQTPSMRAPATYANNWSLRDIKLDIPETGISLMELDRFLRAMLGNDIHVTGEVVRTPSGLALTARAGVEGAESVAGPENELDGLVEKLSESVYSQTQPYRYAIYLGTHERVAEAVPIFKALAISGSVQDRP